MIRIPFKADQHVRCVDDGPWGSVDHAPPITAGRVYVVKHDESDDNVTIMNDRGGISRCNAKRFVYAFVGQEAVA